MKRPSWTLRRTQDEPSRANGAVAARPVLQILVRAGLWSLVALGALGGFAGLAAVAVATSGADPTGEGPPVEPQVPLGVPGVAEHTVRLWITDPTAAAEVLADAATSRVTMGTTWQVADATTVAVREVESGYWAVTVAATVVETGPDDLVSTGVWHVEVGVVDVDGVLGAVTEPALVPAPARPSGIRLAGQPLAVPDRDDPLTAPVAGFLAALLAGEGQVAPYVTADAGIEAVSPAPFVAVVVERQAIEETPSGRRVRTRVRGTTATGGQRTVSYEIDLVARDGRWEVASVSGAPRLRRATGVPPEDAPTSTLPVAPSTTVAGPTSTATSDAPVSPSSTTAVSIASAPGA